MFHAVSICAISILYTIAQASTAPKTNFRNRSHPLESSGAFAEELNKNEDGKEALRKIYVFLNAHSTQASNQVKSWRYGSRLSYPCTPVPGKIIQAVNSSLHSRGLGELDDDTCITNWELQLSESIVSSLHRYFGALDEIKLDVLQKLRSSLKKNGFNENWKNAYLFSTFRYRDSLQNCTLLHMSAFHVFQNTSQGSKKVGIWAVSADMTNEPTLHPMRDRKRHYLAESVYLDSKANVRALDMTINGQPFVKTSLSTWGSIPGASRFSDSPDLRNNPAVDSAIRSHYRERMQAEDLLTSFNVAILLLPLTTALVPVASFADVSRRSMLIYLVLTDVIMMSPLFIKGVELLVLSRGRQSSAYLRIYGALRDQDAGAAQLWYASCIMQNHLIEKGIAFLVIAVLLMMIGISLELLARFRLHKSKRELLLLQEEQGKIGFGSTCDSYIPCSCAVSRGKHIIYYSKYL